ncbi:cation:H+ antiporter [Sporomusaceae bacterium BoRhaA]|uniref:sodium:calcium antiporter n=1 Tax=Pelorhabdus rhamnosifermentans TaxID=2772457 RepID=UPI001FE349EF|nr:sodium:calcium antiporter [Pelorhabdus rhamnosifermentans]MBU2702474.1 cation:H+ antiporter [Pelorhabdus rhamnosifermentans]
MMMLLILTLVLAAVLIYLSCEYFVNGIEWVGRKFHIAGNTVGTVLAAIGTALPESIITLIAVAFGVTESQKDIGVGSALGGPLILSTIGYAVVGWCIFASSKGHVRRRLAIDYGKLSKDQLWFLGIFIFNAVLGFTTFAGKYLAAILLFAVYALYCHKEMCVECELERPSSEPLKIRSKQAEPETKWVLVQTIGSLLFICLGSQIFVNRLEVFSELLGVPSHIIALFLSPIATELPEILNAIIWVRQGKISLALANVSGSMMIQATIPSAFGLLFTPWRFDSYLAMAVIATIASIAFLQVTLKNNHFSAGRLSFAAVFYMMFAAGVYFFSQGFFREFVISSIK